MPRRCPRSLEDPCEEDDPTQYQPPIITYHTIDLKNVNARFINNIPKPNRYPVLGVSNDPDFYHLWYQTGDPYKRSQKFLDPFPFGSEFGYETNIGIVLPPTDPIHGYISPIPSTCSQDKKIVRTQSQWI